MKRITAKCTHFVRVQPLTRLRSKARRGLRPDAIKFGFIGVEAGNDNLQSTIRDG